MQEFILNQVSSYKCKKYNFSVFIEFYRRHNFQDTCGSCGTPPISNCPPPHHSHHKIFFGGWGNPVYALDLPGTCEHQSGRPKDASCGCHQDDLLKWIEGLSCEGSGMDSYGENVKCRDRETYGHKQGTEQRQKSLVTWYPSSWAVTSNNVSRSK